MNTGVCGPILIESEWIHKNCVPDLERLKYIRELMSYAMLCPYSSEFTYQNNCNLYELRWTTPLHWSRQYEWPWILHKTNGRHACVLDIGGCWSVLGYALAKRHCLVQTIDINQESIYKAEESIKAFGTGNIFAKQGDARELPYPDNYFDLVTCVSVLEHIPDQDHKKCIEEIERVLLPGGTALVTVDVKLHGTRRGDSYINLDNLPFPKPANEITLVGNLPDDDGKKLTFTVLLVKITKEK